MKMSQAIDQLATALAKAQGEFLAAERNHTAKVQSKKGEGSSYQYNYADLAAYHEVSRDALAANGLSVVQSPTTDGDKVTTITLLMHASGQYIEFDPLTMIADHKPDEHPTPQAIGSSLTYCRRYALSAALNMAADDEDGAEGSGVKAETTKREPLPECPKCKTNKAVIIGKEEYGGGFLCWKKKDGCGHSWRLNLPPVEGTNGSKVAKGVKLTEEEARYIADASAEINKASCEDDLDILVASFADKSEAIKVALRPLYASRKEVLRTQNAEVPY